MRASLLLAATLCAALVGGCAGDDPEPPAPPPALNVLVEHVGGFKIVPKRFQGRRDSFFVGEARHKSLESPLHLEFRQDRETWADYRASMWTSQGDHTCSSGTVDVPGSGPVRYICQLMSGRPVEQDAPPREPEHEAQAMFTFALEREGSVVTITHWGPTRSVKCSDEPDRTAWEKRVLAQALAEVGDNPALELHSAMAARKRVLATCLRFRGDMRVIASVDEEDFVDLSQGNDRTLRGRSVSTWLLYAKPGQKVTMGVQVPIQSFAITTWGFEECPKPDGCPGLLTVGGREIPLDSEGRVFVDLGTLTSARSILFEGPMDGGARDQSSGALLLRWGRPEEAWLGHSAFPLSPRPGTPDTAAAEQALATDIEAGFDPDRGAYLRTRGRGDPADPVWGTIQVLRRTPDNPGSWLRLVTRNLPVDPDHLGESLDSNEAGRLLAKLTSSPRSSVGDGWGYPRAVFGLAFLWNAFPEIRAKNPLEAVLDQWVAAMKSVPDPVHRMGKSGLVTEDSPTERAFAVAALHLGAEAFDKASFREARDLQLALLRGQVAKAGVFGEGELHKGETGALAHAAAWGQLAAFLGNDEALSEAQDFIVLMLGRGDRRARAAYELYTRAPLDVRAGMLSVLRGNAGFLEPPPVVR